eukprot:CAMPEP_0114112482 /NCGR_PEP_ID=MMETSP0043_2-20121206/2410_1 /TAXON_ID=464988 /ORGANISM="Hemiselmis andersenii, Strain CCMP644" /LENGTH=68 /DNA_ID=CAMNT_0001204583 /DNA_START=96 /DNA_END=302 /DNA_ORIENTATION=-
MAGGGNHQQRQGSGGVSQRWEGGATMMRPCSKPPRSHTQTRAEYACRQTQAPCASPQPSPSRVGPLDS